MAVTVAKVPDAWQVVGKLRHNMVDLTFSGSYSVGGETITPRQVGLTRILNVTGTVTGDTGAVAYQVAYDRTNNKIQLYTSNGASPARLKEMTASAYDAVTVGRLTFVGV